MNFLPWYVPNLFEVTSLAKVTWERTHRMPWSVTSVIRDSYTLSPCTALTAGNLPAERAVQGTVSDLRETLGIPISHTSPQCIAAYPESTGSVSIPHLNLYQPITQVTQYTMLRLCNILTPSIPGYGAFPVRSDDAGSPENTSHSLCFSLASGILLKKNISEHLFHSDICPEFLHTCCLAFSQMTYAQQQGSRQQQVFVYQWKHLLRLINTSYFNEAILNKEPLSPLV